MNSLHKAILSHNIPQAVNLVLNHNANPWEKINGKNAYELLDEMGYSYVTF